MSKLNIIKLLLGCYFLLASLSVYGARIKDLTDVRGSRSNQLYGYGIVTGLAGQGDSRIEYTELGILNALETLGIRADKADKSRNIAAVMVTADNARRRMSLSCWRALEVTRLVMVIAFCSDIHSVCGRGPIMLDSSPASTTKFFLFTVSVRLWRS